MRKRRLKKKAKIIISIGILAISILTYFILGFLGAYKDVYIAGSIIILFGWYWLLAGQIMALYALWRK